MMPPSANGYQLSLPISSLVSVVLSGCADGRPHAQINVLQECRFKAPLHEDARPCPSFWPTVHYAWQQQPQSLPPARGEGIQQKRYRQYVRTDCRSARQQEQGPGGWRARRRRGGTSVGEGRGWAGRVNIGGQR